MDKNALFKMVQQYTGNRPLLLIGTGGTMPYGIPGMGKLAEYLISTLSHKYKLDRGWETFISKINDGLDLESALTDINLNADILKDIITQTWMLVNDADIDLLIKILSDRQMLPLSKLIRKMCIAKDMNLSRSTVKRALHDLTGAGLIEKEPRYRENGSHTSNRLILK